MKAINSKLMDVWPMNNIKLLLVGTSMQKVMLIFMLRGLCDTGHHKFTAKVANLLCILQLFAALPLDTQSQSEHSYIKCITFEILLFCKVYFMAKYLQLS
jgi:hypothetical protein